MGKDIKKSNRVNDCSFRFIRIARWFSDIYFVLNRLRFIFLQTVSRSISLLAFRQ